MLPSYLVSRNLAGQTDRELGELALAAVDGNRASVLLGDDVPADREPETRPFPGRLGREKRLKQLVPDVGRDTGAVVAHPDLDRLAQITGRDLEGRSISGPAVAAGALGGGVEAVAEQVQKHAGHLLWRQLDRCGGGIEIAFQRDVEARILGARTVISEVERLLNKGIEIDRAALARHPARVLQHALDDAIGAPAVLGNLFE